LFPLFYASFVDKSISEDNDDDRETSDILSAVSYQNNVFLIDNDIYIYIHMNIACSIVEVEVLPKV